MKKVSLIPGIETKSAFQLQNYNGTVNTVTDTPSLALRGAPPLLSSPHEV
jgi:hypothetical protein